MMTATVENMQKCEEAGLSVFAYSHTTGEEYSATPGDYWAYESKTEPLRDADGEPMVLVSKVLVGKLTEYVDVEL